MLGAQVVSKLEPPCYSSLHLQSTVSKPAAIRKPLSKFHFLRPYFESNYSVEYSGSIALEIERCIKQTRNFQKETPTFLNLIRSRIIYLHQYNLNVASIALLYPLANSFIQLLLRYVALECKVLYKKEFYTPQYENEVQQRMYRLLMSVYYAYFESRMIPSPRIFEECSKAIINLFIKFKTDYEVNNKLIKNIIVELLKRTGDYDKFVALRGTNQPCSTASYLEGTNLVNVRRDVITSDHGNNFFCDTPTHDDILQLFNVDDSSKTRIVPTICIDDDDIETVYFERECIPSERTMRKLMAKTSQEVKVERVFALHKPIVENVAVIKEENKKDNLCEKPYTSYISSVDNNVQKSLISDEILVIDGEDDSCIVNENVAQLLNASDGDQAYSSPYLRSAPTEGCITSNCAQTRNRQSIKVEEIPTNEKASSSILHLQPKCEVVNTYNIDLTEDDDDEVIEFFRVEEVTPKLEVNDSPSKHPDRLVRKVALNLIEEQSGNQSGIPILSLPNHCQIDLTEEDEEIEVSLIKKKDAEEAFGVLDHKQKGVDLSTKEDIILFKRSEEVTELPIAIGGIEKSANISNLTEVCSSDTQVDITRDTLEVIDLSTRDHCNTSSGSLKTCLAEKSKEVTNSPSTATDVEKSEETSSTTDISSNDFQVITAEEIVEEVGVNINKQDGVGDLNDNCNSTLSSINLEDTDTYSLKKSEEVADLPIATSVIEKSANTSNIKEIFSHIEFTSDIDQEEGVASNEMDLVAEATVASDILEVKCKEGVNLWTKDPCNGEEQDTSSTTGLSSNNFEADTVVNKKDVVIGVTSEGDPCQIAHGSIIGDEDGDLSKKSKKVSDFSVSDKCVETSTTTEVSSNNSHANTRNYIIENVESNSNKNTVVAEAGSTKEAFVVLIHKQEVDSKGGQSDSITESINLENKYTDAFHNKGNLVSSISGETPSCPNYDVDTVVAEAGSTKEASVVLIHEQEVDSKGDESDSTTELINSEIKYTDAFDNKGNLVSSISGETPSCPNYDVDTVVAEAGSTKEASVVLIHEQEVDSKGDESDSTTELINSEIKYTYAFDNKGNLVSSISGETPSCPNVDVDTVVAEAGSTKEASVVLIHKQEVDSKGDQSDRTTESINSENKYTDAFHNKDNLVSSISGEPPSCPNVDEDAEESSINSLDNAQCNTSSIMQKSILSSGNVVTDDTTKIVDYENPVVDEIEAICNQATKLFSGVHSTTLFTEGNLGDEVVSQQSQEAASIISSTGSEELPIPVTPNRKQLLISEKTDKIYVLPIENIVHAIDKNQRKSDGPKLLETAAKIEHLIVEKVTPSNEQTKNDICKELIVKLEQMKGNPIQNKHNLRIVTECHRVAESDMEEKNEVFSKFASTELEKCNTTANLALQDLKINENEDSVSLNDDIVMKCFQNLINETNTEEPLPLLDKGLEIDGEESKDPILIVIPTAGDVAHDLNIHNYEVVITSEQLKTLNQKYVLEAEDMANACTTSGSTKQMTEDKAPHDGKECTETSVVSDNTVFSIYDEDTQDERLEWCYDVKIRAEVVLAVPKTNDIEFGQLDQVSVKKKCITEIMEPDSTSQYVDPTNNDPEIQEKGSIPELIEHQIEIKTDCVVQEKNKQKTFHTSECSKEAVFRPFRTMAERKEYYRLNLGILNIDCSDSQKAALKNTRSRSLDGNLLRIQKLKDTKEADCEIKETLGKLEVSKSEKFDRSSSTIDVVSIPSSERLKVKSEAGQLQNQTKAVLELQTNKLQVNYSEPDREVIKPGTSPIVDVSKISNSSAKVDNNLPMEKVDSIFNTVDNEKALGNMSWLQTTAIGTIVPSCTNTEKLTRKLESDMKLQKEKQMGLKEPGAPTILPLLDLEEPLNQLETVDRKHSINNSKDTILYENVKKSKCLEIEMNKGVETSVKSVENAIEEILHNENPLEQRRNSPVTRLNKTSGCEDRKDKDSDYTNTDKSSETQLKINKLSRVPVQQSLDGSKLNKSKSTSVTEKSLLHMNTSEKSKPKLELPTMEKKNTSKHDGSKSSGSPSEKCIEKSSGAGTCKLVRSVTSDVSISSSKTKPIERRSKSKSRKSRSSSVSSVESLKVGSSRIVENIDTSKIEIESAESKSDSKKLNRVRSRSSDRKSKSRSNFENEVTTTTCETKSNTVVCSSELIKERRRRSRSKGGEKSRMSPDNSKSKSSKSRSISLKVTSSGIVESIDSSRKPEEQKIGIESVEHKSNYGKLSRTRSRSPDRKTKAKSKFVNERKYPKSKDDESLSAKNEEMKSGKQKFEKVKNVDQVEEVSRKRHKHDRDPSKTWEGDRKNLGNLDLLPESEIGTVNPKQECPINIFTESVKSSTAHDNSKQFVKGAKEKNESRNIESTSKSHVPNNSKTSQFVDRNPDKYQLVSSTNSLQLIANYSTVLSSPKQNVDMPEQEVMKENEGLKTSTTNEKTFIGDKNETKSKGKTSKSVGSKPSVQNISKTSRSNDANLEKCQMVVFPETSSIESPQLSPTIANNSKVLPSTQSDSSSTINNFDPKVEQVDKKRSDKSKSLELPPKQNVVEHQDITANLQVPISVTETPPTNTSMTLLETKLKNKEIVNLLGGNICNKLYEISEDRSDNEEGQLSASVEIGTSKLSGRLGIDEQVENITIKSHKYKSNSSSTSTENKKHIEVSSIVGGDHRNATNIFSQTELLGSKSIYEIKTETHFDRTATEAASADVLTYPENGGTSRKPLQKTDSVHKIGSDNPSTNGPENEEISQTLQQKADSACKIDNINPQCSNESLSMEAMKENGYLRTMTSPENSKQLVEDKNKREKSDNQSETSRNRSKSFVLNKSKISKLLTESSQLAAKIVNNPTILSLIQLNSSSRCDTELPVEHPQDSRSLKLFPEQNIVGCSEVTANLVRKVPHVSTLSQFEILMSKIKEVGSIPIKNEDSKLFESEAISNDFTNEKPLSKSNRKRMIQTKGSGASINCASAANLAVKRSKLNKEEHPPVSCRREKTSMESIIDEMKESVSIVHSEDIDVSAMKRKLSQKIHITPKTYESDLVVEALNDDGVPEVYPEPTCGKLANLTAPSEQTVDFSILNEKIGTQPTLYLEDSLLKPNTELQHAQSSELHDISVGMGLEQISFLNSSLDSSAVEERILEKVKFINNIDAHTVPDYTDYSNSKTSSDVKLSPQASSADFTSNCGTKSTCSRTELLSINCNDTSDELLSKVHIEQSQNTNESKLSFNNSLESESESNITASFNSTPSETSDTQASTVNFGDLNLSNPTDISNIVVSSEDIGILSKMITTLTSVDTLLTPTTPSYSRNTNRQISTEQNNMSDIEQIETSESWAIVDANLSSSFPDISPMKMFIDRNELAISTDNYISEMSLTNERISMLSSPTTDDCSPPYGACTPTMIDYNHGEPNDHNYYAGAGGPLLCSETEDNYNYNSPASTSKDSNDVTDNAREINNEDSSDVLNPKQESGSTQKINIDNEYAIKNLVSLSQSSSDANDFPLPNSSEVDFLIGLLDTNYLEGNSDSKDSDSKRGGDTWDQLISNENPEQKVVQNEKCSTTNSIAYIDTKEPSGLNKDSITEQVTTIKESSKDKATNQNIKTLKNRVTVASTSSSTVSSSPVQEPKGTAPKKMKLILPSGRSPVLAPPKRKPVTTATVQNQKQSSKMNVKANKASTDGDDAGDSLILLPTMPPIDAVKPKPATKTSLALPSNDISPQVKDKSAAKNDVKMEKSSMETKLTDNGDDLILLPTMNPIDSDQPKTALPSKDMSPSNKNIRKLSTLEIDVQKKVTPRNVEKLKMSHKKSKISEMTTAKTPENVSDNPKTPQQVVLNIFDKIKLEKRAVCMRKSPTQALSTVRNPDNPTTSRTSPKPMIRLPDIRIHEKYIPKNPSPPVPVVKVPPPKLSENYIIINTDNLLKLKMKPVHRNFQSCQNDCKNNDSNNLKRTSPIEGEPTNKLRKVEGKSTDKLFDVLVKQGTVNPVLSLKVPEDITPRPINERRQYPRASGKQTTHHRDPAYGLPYEKRSDLPPARGYSLTYHCQDKWYQDKKVNSPCADSRLEMRGHAPASNSPMRRLSSENPSGSSSPFQTHRPMGQNKRRVFERRPHVSTSRLFNPSGSSNGLRTFYKPGVSRTPHLSEDP